MARRPIWKGVVTFGMVAIPIRIYTATESKDISFSLLHNTCHTRLRQKRYCPQDETEVGPEEVVRAYEYTKDQFVVMGDSDFENLPVASTRTIEIIQFVDMSQIDPINFERTYMLEPEGVGVKPFYLLKQALEDSGRAAVAKVSLRQKEQICCLRPYGHALALHTMYYPDEVRGTTELKLPEEKVAITEQEMAMAVTLIDHLTGPYAPSQYQDEYRLELEKVIQSKLTSQEPVVTAAPQPAGKIGDLMDALKASIAAAKKERTEAEPLKPPQHTPGEGRTRKPAQVSKKAS